MFWGLGKGFRKKRHQNQDCKKFSHNHVNDIKVIWGGERVLDKEAAKRRS